MSGSADILLLTFLKITTMKKLFLLAGCYCLHFSSPAQDLSPKNFPDKLHAVSSDGRSAGYDRARRHFNDKYPGISDVLWTNLPDGGFVCWVHEPEMATHVHYDRRGNWICTISGYEDRRLPEEIKEAVQNHYEGYRITFVNQIISKADLPIYIINIESWTEIKVIRVIGDDIEVRQELEKE
jgi:hypothetical protein